MPIKRSAADETERNQAIRVAAALGVTPPITGVLPTLLLLALFGFLAYQVMSASSEVIFDNDWHAIQTPAQIPERSPKSQ